MNSSIHQTGPSRQGQTLVQCLLLIFPFGSITQHEDSFTQDSLATHTLKWAIGLASVLAISPGVVFCRNTHSYTAVAAALVFGFVSLAVGAPALQ